jgi:hypothetical protein
MRNDSRWVDTTCSGCGRAVAADREGVAAGTRVLCTICEPRELPIRGARRGVIHVSTGEDAIKIGTVSNTSVLVQPDKGGVAQVAAESGGRVFAWDPDGAEQIAGLLLRAARIARAQAGCIRP